MPLQGLAYGAAQGLENVLARRFEQQKLQELIANREAELAQQAARDAANQATDQRRLELEGQRVGLEERRLEGAETERARAARERQNQLGVQQMAGEFISQGQGAYTPEDVRGFDRLAIEMGETPKIQLPPPEKKYQVTVPGARGPVSRLVPESEMEQGVNVYREPHTPPADSNDQIWVTRGGKLTPIAKGSAQPGDVPYDPVAARGGQMNAAELMDTASEIERVSTALRNHPGRFGAFGLYQSKLPTFRQGTADAENLLKSLQGLLTLENTGKLKGVLSNADMEVLRRASTTLDATTSDAAAEVELDRIAKVMQKVTGSGGAPPPSDGGTGPKVGETRTVNGVTATWNGKAWVQ